MTVTLRFDDHCGNGRQDFGITADITTPASRRRDDVEACGCLHDDITCIFPELEPLIKWHLVSTNGPMHYVENTLFHASDRDSSGRKAGEPSAFDKVIFIGNSPYPVKLKPKFWAWLEFAKASGTHLKVVEVHHENKSDPRQYQYKPGYSFEGFDTDWTHAPFTCRIEAEAVAEGVTNLPVVFSQVPTAFSEGKVPDFDAARQAGLWPEATDEQLSLPKEELKALLLERLGPLTAHFKKVMTEECQFLWEPDNG